MRKDFLKRWVPCLAALIIGIVTITLICSFASLNESENIRSVTITLTIEIGVALIGGVLSYICIRAEIFNNIEEKEKENYSNAIPEFFFSNVSSSNFIVVKNKTNKHRVFYEKLTTIVCSDKKPFSISEITFKSENSHFSFLPINKCHIFNNENCEIRVDASLKEEIKEFELCISSEYEKGSICIKYVCRYNEETKIFDKNKIYEELIPNE